MWCLCLPPPLLIPFQSQSPPTTSFKSHWCITSSFIQFWWHHNYCLWSSVCALQCYCLWWGKTDTIKDWLISLKSLFLGQSFPLIKSGLWILLDACHSHLFACEAICGPLIQPHFISYLLLCLFKALTQLYCPHNLPQLEIMNLMTLVQFW